MSSDKLCFYSGKGSKKEVEFFTNWGSQQGSFSTSFFKISFVPNINLKINFKQCFFVYRRLHMMLFMLWGGGQQSLWRLFSSSSMNQDSVNNEDTVYLSQIIHSKFFQLEWIVLWPEDYERKSGMDALADFSKVWDLSVLFNLTQLLTMNRGKKQILFE